MGQTVSVDGSKQPNPVDVVIEYTDATSSKPEKIEFNTDILSRYAECKELANRLKTEAIDNNISVTIDLGSSFTPTHVLRSEAMKKILFCEFRGVFVTKLIIKGDFHDDISDWDKKWWWAEFQLFATSLGFELRNFCTITCLAADVNVIEADVSDATRREYMGINRFTFKA
jgi:hypothetical protein